MKTMTKKILTSLILSILLAATVQAAIGIPENLQPKNVPLKGLNKTVTEQVAINGQDGAVTGANIILQYIANILLYFAAPLAVLFLSRAGVDYAFAMGEDSKLEGAKRELTWSLLGLLLVMFSYVLVRAFIEPFPLLQDATDTMGPSKSFIDESTQKALDKPFGSDLGKVDGINTSPSLSSPKNAEDGVNGLKFDPGEPSSLNTPFKTDPSLSKPILGL